MGDLRDQLLKAGLVSKKQSKHAERVARTKQQQNAGPDVQSTANDETKAPLPPPPKEPVLSAEVERSTTSPKRDLLSADEIQEVIAKLAASGAVTKGLHGRQKFYFVARNLKIPFLLLGDEVSRDLESGKVAIVEHQGPYQEIFTVVSADTARRIQEVDPAAVRFFNG